MGMVYYFTAKVNETFHIPTQEALPIFNGDNILLGSFVYLSFGSIQGFVGGTGYPESLAVSTGGSFWFTPVIGPNGKVFKGLVTEFKLGAYSVEVQARASNEY